MLRPEDKIAFANLRGLRKLPSGIYKDRATGMYHARVHDSDPDYQTVRDIAMELAAVKLSFTELMKQLMTIKATDNQVIVDEAKSNIIDLAQAREKRARPVSQPGNEAEDLSYEATHDTHVLPTSVDPVDLHPGNVTPHTPLGSVYPQETEQMLREITSASVDEIADSAWLHGMDIVEATEILYNEFARREMQCYDRYGISRDEVKYVRYCNQWGAWERAKGKCINIRLDPWSEQCGFRSWNRNIEACMLEWRRTASANLQEHLVTHVMEPIKLHKGEILYRKRQVEEQKEYARVRIAVLLGSYGRKHKFARIQSIHRKLYVPDQQTTTRLQLRAIHSAWWGMINTTRKLLRMQPKLHTTKLYQGYQDERDHALADAWRNVGLLPKSTISNQRGPGPLAVTARDRMVFISSELVRRGIYTVKEVEAMQLDLQYAFGVHLDGGTRLAPVPKVGLLSWRSQRTKRAA